MWEKTKSILKNVAKMTGIDGVLMSLIVMTGSLHWTVKHFFVHAMYKEMYKVIFHNVSI